jgi:hypothetical protein
LALHQIERSFSTLVSSPGIPGRFTPDWKSYRMTRARACSGKPVADVPGISAHLPTDVNAAARTIGDVKSMRRVRQSC